jgi:molybdate transport system substrate-binding protein
LKFRYDKKEQRNIIKSKVFSYHHQSNQYEEFNMKLRTFLLTLFITFMSAIPSQAETVYLSVAASMTEAFKEIISTFSSTHPEAKILPNFASSGSLAKQINQGAPAHIYVSANPKWMKFLVEKEMIAKGTDHIFAYNKLVFVAPEKTTIKNMEDVKDLSLIAIGSPNSVPAGQYAKQAMEATGIYAHLESTKKLVMAKDVRQALLYADRGEVDGSFVYKTDALLARNAKILFTVPDDRYNRVAYPLALTKTGLVNKAAQDFYSFMSTPDAVNILKKYGFEPAL